MSTISGSNDLISYNYNAIVNLFQYNWNYGWAFIGNIFTVGFNPDTYTNMFNLDTYFNWDNWTNNDDYYGTFQRYNPFYWFQRVILLPTYVAAFITFWFIVPFVMINVVIEIFDSKPLWDFFWDPEGEYNLSDVWINMNIW